MAGFTVDQLTALEAAIGSGELVVRYGDKTVEYRSIAELMRARDAVRTSLVDAGLLAASTTRGSHTYAAFARR